MKGIIKKQAMILLALWVAQVAAAVLSANFGPLLRFLESNGLYGHDSFALLVIALMSTIAFTLNTLMGPGFSSRAWRNFWISIPASIALANIAYWIMVVPAWVVLFELGLVGK